jgi:hypothetical protein
MVEKTRSRTCSSIQGRKAAVMFISSCFLAGQTRTAFDQLGAAAPHGHVIDDEHRFLRKVYGQSFGSFYPPTTTTKAVHIRPASASSVQRPTIASKGTKHSHMYIHTRLCYRGRERALNKSAAQYQTRTCPTDTYMHDSTCIHRGLDCISAFCGKHTHMTPIYVYTHTHTWHVAETQEEERTLWRPRSAPGIAPPYTYIHT